MAPSGDEPFLFDDREGLNHTPPGEGFELYRHKDAGKMRTRNWHGYYWARVTEEGDYEIRSVPASLGEQSAPGALCQRRGSMSTTRRLAFSAPYGHSSRGVGNNRFQLL
jgi:hypothetical protein